MSVARRNIESVLSKFGLSHHLQELSDRKLYNLIINFMNCESLKQHSFEDLKSKKKIVLPIPLEDQLLLYKHALQLENNLDI